MIRIRVLLKSPNQAHAERLVIMAIKQRSVPEFVVFRRDRLMLILYSAFSA